MGYVRKCQFCGYDAPPGQGGGTTVYLGKGAHKGCLEQHLHNRRRTLDLLAGLGEEEDKGEIALPVEEEDKD